MADEVQAATDRRLQPLPAWTRALGALAGIAVAVWIGPRLVDWVVSHPHFAVDGVEFPYETLGRRSAAIGGQARVTPEELAAWAGVTPGTSWFTVHAATLERRLEDHPWVRRATVRLQPPRRVLARVVQRRAIAIARLDELYYVDRRGVLIAPLGPDDSRDLPIVSGLDRSFGRASVRVALPRVAALLRRYEGASWLGAISEVHVDAEGGATLFPVSTRATVKLGWGGWYAKLARGERVMLARRGETASIASIDLTHGTAVVVRTQQPPTTKSTAARGTEV